MYKLFKELYFDNKKESLDVKIKKRILVLKLTELYESLTFFCGRLNMLKKLIKFILGDEKMS